MSKFRIIRLPDDAPGLNVEGMQQGQHLIDAVGADPDTPAKKADRKLPEFIVMTYTEDIFIRAM
ncbi:hypothetical protein ARSEF4850_008887, partial [Beauveria asiatica]